MFSELNALTDISDTSPPKGKFILLSDAKSDGSFLIHHFLSMYIRGGFHVVFLALAQSMAHYNSVAQKLGINMSSALEHGQLKFFDGLCLVSQALSEDQAGIAHDSPGDKQEPNPFHNIRGKTFTLQALFSRLKSLVEGSSRPSMLLIDDLGVLLSVGVPAQDILDFTQYCCSLMFYSSKVADGCFVCLVHDDSDADDDDSVLLWKQLSHSAHVTFHVEGLSTGYSKDVHGQLTITWRMSDQPISPHASRKIITQYKIQDKNVAFFAPGTSKAVL